MKLQISSCGYEGPCFKISDSHGNAYEDLKSVKDKRILCELKRTIMGNFIRFHTEQMTSVNCGINTSVVQKLNEQENGNIIAAERINLITFT
jgi:hypothetical protein